MVVIGLTGNIATGKSTVARMLADLGADVIDADIVAHEVQAPGSAVHRAIIDRFGESILASDGAIDRKALGAIVFADAQALADLESLVHPAVEAEIRRRLERADAPAVVIEAIKLLEAKLDCYCDTIWVTTCPRETQLQRLIETRGLDRAQATQRIDAQPDPSLKVAQADVVIDNAGSLAATQAQVQRAWHAITPSARRRPWQKLYLLQWLVLTLAMVALLPLGSRLIGWSDWRQWLPLVPVCAAMAAASVWLIHGS